MLDRTKFYAAVRGPGKLFPALTVSQVRGIEAIFDCWDNNPHDFADRRHLSYALSTVYHETDRAMQPIAEYGKGSGKSYGNPSAPYSQKYYGRGLVQLTWWYNYVKAQIELADMGIKLDLVRNPDLALSATGAPQILLYGMTQGWFTGRKLSDYFDINANDPVGARHIINGSDRAADIAGYFRSFDAALIGASQ